jgi:hypothetical protein
MAEGLSSFDQALYARLRTGRKRSRTGADRMPNGSTGMQKETRQFPGRRATWCGVNDDAWDADEGMDG